MAELRACPARLETGEHGGRACCRVVCTGCPMRTPWYLSAEKAALAWDGGRLGGDPDGPD